MQPGRSFNIAGDQRTQPLALGRPKALNLWILTLA
jgi:hypothetical protein